MSVCIYVYIHTYMYIYIYIYIHILACTCRSTCWPLCTDDYCTSTKMHWCQYDGIHHALTNELIHQSWAWNPQHKLSCAGLELEAIAELAHNAEKQDCQLRTMFVKQPALNPDTANPQCWKTMFPTGTLEKGSSGQPCFVAANFECLTLSARNADNRVAH